MVLICMKTWEIKTHLIEFFLESEIWERKQWHDIEIVVGVSHGHYFLLIYCYNNLSHNGRIGKHLSMSFAEQTAR